MDENHFDMSVMNRRFKTRPINVLTWLANARLNGVKPRQVLLNIQKVFIQAKLEFQFK